jgi:hypothetical protein
MILSAARPGKRLSKALDGNLARRTGSAARQWQLWAFATYRDVRECLSMEVGNRRLQSSVSRASILSSLPEPCLR